MKSDEQVIAILDKYVHFNSVEDIQQFKEVFFKWLEEYGREMVVLGLKNGWSAAMESVVVTIDKINEEGGCSLETLAKVIKEIECPLREESL